MCIRDRFYYLAKEQGFRSRAAFKLVQLNQKFNFLGSAHCVVDLCAAPGSWCQVAAKYCPISSVIIGLDLVAIRPIRNVQTFAQDITQYDKCKAIVKGAIKEKFNHMVDVVLNDGAPNVGASWVKDAYTQTELVLCALRLACEILRPGGTFVTKVFRSQDYNSMMWVMNQFFEKVVAHKPSASRGVSAEIFVVCQGFKAPKKVDPKFFDPTHIFKEIQGPGPVDVLKRKKETRSRDGYDPELGHGLFRACPVDQFVEAAEPVQILSTWNKIDLKTSANEAVLEAVNSCPDTTDEIRTLCDDLKVLSKSDFKLLLRWRQKLEDLLKPESESEEEESDEPEEHDPELEALKEEERALAAVGEVTADLAARKKRLKKKLALRRQKLQRRVDMKMHGQEEVDLAEAAGQRDGLFDLSTMDADADGIDRVQEGEVADLSESEEEEEIDLEPKAAEDYDEQEENWLDKSYNDYKGRRGIKEKRAEAKNEETMPYLMQVELDQEEGEPERGVEEFGSGDESEEEEAVPRIRGNPMLNDLDDSVKESSAAKAERFFSGSLFQGIEEADEEHIERRKKRKIQKEREEKAAVDAMNADFAQATGGKAPASKGTKRKQADWESEEEDEEDEMLDKINAEDARRAAEFNERTKLLPKKENDLAETLAFGELMLRKKQRYAVVDASYNRYAYNDDQKVLPDWFREDEAKFNVPELPITKAQVARIKESWKAVDARPIKKVAEAKAKQKKRKVAAMAKLTKQATSALNNEEETSAKRESILKKLIAGNAGKTRRSKVNTVVSTKGGPKKGGGSKGGKVKVVDKRMKKDSRGAKTAMRKAMKANHGRLPKAMVQQAKAMKVKNKHQNY
eukprot:TRINITY_DN7120_c0_g1_i3.p1 TRINITY_DN7120_c0_g1~~TRINITY_DN7120_c0_g1_i3.p1  ORF type:complete len:853 (-),score=356.21 TRINITY_DN7120_c0_g1_i3:39-2597(-)